MLCPVVTLGADQQKEEACRHVLVYRGQFNEALALGKEMAIEPTCNVRLVYDDQAKLGVVVGQARWPCIRMPIRCQERSETVMASYCVEDRGQARGQSLCDSSCLELSSKSRRALGTSIMLKIFQPSKVSVVPTFAQWFVTKEFIRGSKVDTGALMINMPGGEDTYDEGKKYDAGAAEDCAARSPGDNTLSVLLMTLGSLGQLVNVVRVDKTSWAREKLFVTRSR
ncbi:hypothetical protein S40293_10546 [Stachybotrys chartarum IBT 40293]|nr:hypothetical protein S40293_10546 [Stachybotrys chartarum IBT 40293]